MIHPLASYIQRYTNLDFETDQLKVATIYRYLSWILTSLFYICTPSVYEVYKFGVIVSLLICSTIIIKAYKIYAYSKINIKTFIVIETAGIILLLLPTGGLKSPFIWYALNPILISAFFSFYYFCWLNLICYLLTSIIISYLLFNQANNSFNTMISNNSDKILIFILITLAVNLLSIVTNKLRSKSYELSNAMEQLNKANKINQESLDYIKSLYRMVETLNEQDSKKNCHKTFTDYLVKITKTDFGFFLLESFDCELNKFAINGNCPDETQQDLRQKVIEIWKSNLLDDKAIYFDLNGSNYCALNVKSSIRNYGFIGVRMIDLLSDLDIKEMENNLEFISNLSAVILDRFHFEEVSQKLLLSEEQNRIANEMHDNVIQQVFGISCIVHTSLGDWSNIKKDVLKDKLLSIQNSAQLVMKELRLVIYNLSSRKGGTKNFQFSINNYLDSISRLNNIDAKFTINGDEELIDISKKRGLYRIICEATSNAVRHGKCSIIQIDLTVTAECIELKIADNGMGFDVNYLKQKGNNGLGLENMINLAKLLGGEINIDSEIDKGTIISICLDNIYQKEFYKEIS